MAPRTIAWILLGLVLLGPVQPLAGAQGQAPPTPEQLERTRDAREAAAGFLTVLKAPFNVALCLIGVGAGVGLLALTAGYGHSAAWTAMEQGCDQKWVVRAEDLEPGPPPRSKAFDWETHRFDWEPQ